MGFEHPAEVQTKGVDQFDLVALSGEPVPAGAGHPETYLSRMRWRAVPHRVGNLSHLPASPYRTTSGAIIE